MSFVMPEIVIRKVIDHGIKSLRADKPAFDDLFDQLLQDELNIDYGADYKEKIWEWFTSTNIPVVQAWSFNAQKIPCISIHLANESEDESKAAFDDYAGSFNQDYETGTGVFTVMIDVGIHANKGGDHVLWMYYIVAYILFKQKPMAFRLGIKLSTFSASDYSKDADKMGNNVWTRWVRFRCTTENFWGAAPLTQIDNINIDHTINEPVIVNINGSPTTLAPPSITPTPIGAPVSPAAAAAAQQAAAGVAAVIAANIAGGDLTTVDPTQTQGLRASRVGDDEDIEDLNI